MGLVIFFEPFETFQYVTPWCVSFFRLSTLGINRHILRFDDLGGPNHRNETLFVFRFHETILSFGEPGSLDLPSSSSSLYIWNQAPSCQYIR